MKQSEIITTILVASIGIFITSFLCNMLLGNPDDLTATFSTIAPIDAELSNPDPEVFNVQAINPTVEVYVGECVDVDQDGVLDNAERASCGYEEDEGEGDGEEPAPEPAPAPAPEPEPEPEETPEPLPEEEESTPEYDPVEGR